MQRDFSWKFKRQRGANTFLHPKILRKQKRLPAKDVYQGQNLFPKVATVLKKYDLPEELKILLTLESAYNANAVSCAGAVGYWQIMDEVAKEYGMKYIARVSKAEKRELSKLKNSKKGKPVKALAKLKDDRKNFNIATLTAAR